MRKLLTLCSVLGILSFASCSINIHGLNGGKNLDFIKTNNESQALSINGIKKVKLDIDVGDCIVTFDDKAESVINVDYEFKAISAEKAEKAMNNTKLRCETKDNTLHIDFIDSETGKKIGESSNFLNIVTDVEIILSKSAVSFDISTDVGDIDISGFSGSFDISSDVGDIYAKNLTVMDKSDFDADVGNIDCEITNLSASELELKSDVGDIDLSLGTVEKSEISVDSNVGDIKLDTEGKNYDEVSSKKDTVEQKKKIIVDDKCTVEMKADVGDIKISK